MNGKPDDLIHARDMIKTHNFQVKKNFGQNFLVDPFVLDKIIQGAELTHDDFVLEIGPGLGSLTKELSRAAGNVLAIEIDKNLCTILEENLASYGNVDIIEGDIMKIDLMEIVPPLSKNKPIKVVANLPYYITSPVVMGMLEKWRKPLNIKSLTVMVQREVAERMAAKPGTKDYGALSVAVQYYSETSILANVPPNAFVPRPRVGSSVIQLDILENLRVQVLDEQIFFLIVSSAFEQRRKMLLNALFNKDSWQLTKEEIGSLLEKCGLPLDIRGEKLSVEEFAKLANEFTLFVRDKKGQTPAE